MKSMFAVLALSALVVCAGCKKEDDPPLPKIEGLTLDNFPVLDGSTSTDPLVRLIACELLGYKYQWERSPGMATWELSTWLPERFVQRKLMCSQTHNAIMNLMGDGFTGGTVPDIVFSARKMSADEKAAADLYGVTLIETPIALDALVFIAHAGVGVNSLTHRQLQDIYTTRIRNWDAVGGGTLDLIPFIRNKNSGSQELMESLVMTEPIPDGFYEDHYEDFQPVPSMYPLLTEVGHTPGGLGYTVYYYLEYIVRDGIFDELKTLSVDGVRPDRNTIKNRTYPFTSEVYMMIRSDLDRSSMAYKVYEFMRTEAGKRIVDASGYVAN